jgi:hypothetical protein
MEFSGHRKLDIFSNHNSVRAIGTCGTRYLPDAPEKTRLVAAGDPPGSRESRLDCTRGYSAPAPKSGKLQLETSLSLLKIYTRYLWSISVPIYIEKGTTGFEKYNRTPMVRT